MSLGTFFWRFKRFVVAAGLPSDVLPLLAVGLLPGAADGHGVGGGVQGGAARAAVPRALHAAAASHHGLRQGRCRPPTGHSISTSKQQCLCASHKQHGWTDSFSVIVRYYFVTHVVRRWTCRHTCLRRLIVLVLHRFFTWIWGIFLRSCELNKKKNI